LAAHGETKNLPQKAKARLQESGSIFAYFACLLLYLLVAGTGFEPVTFGL
jgi:hypothetical protein